MFRQEIYKISKQNMIGLAVVILYNKVYKNFIITSYFIQLIKPNQILIKIYNKLFNL